MRRRILFVVNDPAFFASHRLPIGKAAVAAGFEVHLAGSGNPPDALSNCDIEYHQIYISRKGRNPFAELLLLIRLARLFVRIKPDIVHLITIKAYLYGGIAARLTGVPMVISAVAGLGAVGTRRDLSAKIFRALLYPLYKVAFGHNRQYVIFQNSHDRDMLIRWGVVTAAKCILIRGSGVDLEGFSRKSKPLYPAIVSLAARLLKDKGILEFVQAARILRSKDVRARFWLIGDIDPGNPASLTAAELQAIRDEGVVEVLGYRHDIAGLYSKSSVICFPSYYGEGLPKTLVEAAAAGRAVITTDHPGCRDAIEPNVSGLLVPVRDSKTLATAISRLLNDAELLKSMGEAGRALAEREYGIAKIVEEHLKIYRQLSAEDS